MNARARRAAAAGAILGAACAASHFERAVIPEPTDRGAEAAVRARQGTVEAVLIERAILILSHDDATTLRVFWGHGERDVRIERRFSIEEGRAVVEVVAAEIAHGSAEELRSYCLRRVVGSGSITIERRGAEGATAPGPATTTQLYGRVQIPFLLEPAVAMPPGTVSGRAPAR